MQYKLSEIARITSGDFNGTDSVVTNIIYDSRRLTSSHTIMFVAIKNSIRDGHNYISELISKGVTAFLVCEDYTETDIKGVGFVKVKEPIKALQALATHHRQTMQMPIVAIAGSSGKTVVKEWISQLWSGGTLFRSPRSYNSQLGVALSILMIKGNEQLAIIETAISQPNEMESLEEMVRPEIVLFTNVRDAHSDNFDSLEHMLQEKLIIARRASKVIVCGNMNNLYPTIKNRYSTEKIFTWGKGNFNVNIIEKDSNHIKIRYKNNDFTIPLHFTDRYSFENLMAVIALNACMDYDLAKLCGVCNQLEGVEVRFKLDNGINRCKVISDISCDDINALRIAIESASSMTHNKPKILILGSMLHTYTSELTQLLENSNIEKLYTINTEVKYHSDEIHYRDIDMFLSNVYPTDFNDKTILILGGGDEFKRISNSFVEKHHTTVMEVNLSAMINNLSYYKLLVGKEVKICAMVKALSYGSGSHEIALALSSESVDYLAVAYLDEGIALRANGVTMPIIILNSNINDYDIMFNNALQPEIYSFYTFESFVAKAKERGFKEYPIHIKIDTGMSRLGFNEDDISLLSELIERSEEVKIESIFSHFSSSDMPENDCESKRQIALFEHISSMLTYKLRHICNSAGIERLPEAHYDMVRLGLGLYGINPTGDNDKLENVNSLHTIVLQVRNIKRGTYISYAMRGYADKDMTIATVGIGYADGLRRNLSNNRWAMKVCGGYAPIIGNICMDTCMIDVTNLNVKEGDRVTVFDSSEEICRMAEILGTIPYEILTSISTRIKRVYIRE